MLLAKIERRERSLSVLPAIKEATLSSDHFHYRVEQSRINQDLKYYFYCQQIVLDKSREFLHFSDQPASKELQKELP